MDERITRTLVPRPSYGLRFAAEGVRGQSSRSGSMRNATWHARRVWPVFTCRFLLRLTTCVSC